MADVRPMTPDDVPAAEEAFRVAIGSMRAALHFPEEAVTPDVVERGRRRVAYLLGTDPDGSWVATVGDRLVGMAQAQIRGDRWVLANLGVAPGHQDAGVGRELLERTLEHGRDVPRGAIFASPDPRALQRYVRAGFTLQPAAQAFGRLRRVPASPSGVEEAGAEALDHVDAVDRAVRGVTRRADIEFQLDGGARLLVDPAGGYAVTAGGRLASLAATDEELAKGLLRAHLARAAGADGGTVDVGWITGRDQWAVTTLAEGALPLHLHGAVMTRGPWEMDGAYLPHGVFG